MKTDPTFDLFDSDQTHSLWDTWKEMRAQCPVSHPMEGIAFTATYKETDEVFRDSARFSAREGFRAPGVVLPFEESFLAEIDPPEHTPIRRLLHKSLTPNTATAAEPFTRRFMDELLAEIDERGEGDLVGDFSLQVPVAVTGHVLGVPLEDIPQVSAWLFELLHSTWPVTNRTERGEGIGGAFPEMAAYYDAAIAARRASDGEPADLMAKMVQAEDAGNRLSDLHIRTLAVNMSAASLSTTVMIGSLLHRVLTDPELEHRLRQQPELHAAAVEETLRLDPPVMFLFRTAKQDTEVGGVPIAAGERVCMGIASANRDEARFADADAFDLDRVDPPGNLAFGAGPHLCIGNHLARMEGRIALEAFFARFPEGSVQLAPDFEYKHVDHFLEHGPKTLPVVVRR